MKMRYFVILAAVIGIIAVVVFGSLPAQNGAPETQPSSSAIDQNP